MSVTGAPAVTDCKVIADFAKAGFEYVRFIDLSLL